MGGIDVVVVDELEEQIVGGDVDASGGVDGHVLSETDDDLEVVVQSGQVEGRQENVAEGVEEVGVDGVETVGGVVVELPVEAVLRGQVSGFEVLLKGQEELTKAGGGSTDLVDPVASEDEASGGALGLTIAGVHGDVEVGDVVAVETVVGWDPEEVADLTLDGEVDVGAWVSVLSVDSAMFNDVEAGAETVAGVSVELLTSEASGVGASARSLVVRLTRQATSRDVEGASGSAVGESAWVSGVSGASAGVGVESSTTEAVEVGGASARASDLVVVLEVRARGDDEGAGGGRVSEAAWVNGKSRALAGEGVEGGGAWAGQNVRALALASVLVVGLRGWARGDDERAGSGGVSQTAWVNGEGSALASGSVEGGTAWASESAGALALTRGLRVSLRVGATGDDEGAEAGAVSQTALVSGVSRALASGGVESSTAQAVGGAGVTALTRASGVAVNLRSVARRHIELADSWVENQVARVSGVSRASASGSVKGGTTEASSSGGADTLARVLVVGLRGWARWDGERAGGGGVSQTAWVNREWVALASGGVEADRAWASQDRGALALASVLIVNQRRGTRGDGEGACVDVEDQSTETGGEGRALASRHTVSSSAWASLDIGASARTRGLVVDLRKVASGDDKGAGNGVVDEAASVSGESRARASECVEGGTTQASSDRGALASTSSLTVGLGVRARWDGERASGGGVGEAAWVNREWVALASGGVEADRAWASQDRGALALASVLIVNQRRGTRGDGEGAGVDVEDQSTETSWERRALASDGGEGSSAWASQGTEASARARSLIVDLRKVASGDNEGASGSVVNEAASVGGEGRTLASECVEGGAAWADGNRRALASTSSLVVHLWVRARWDGERAGGGGVGEAAWVNREWVALASVGVEANSARAGQDRGALAGASSLRVDLGRGASGDVEGAAGGVVSQTASVDGVSRASTGGGVEDGTAETVGDNWAHARADTSSLVVGLGSSARGDDEGAGGG